MNTPKSKESHSSISTPTPLNIATLLNTPRSTRSSRRKREDVVDEFQRDELTKSRLDCLEQDNTVSQEELYLSAKSKDTEYIFEGSGGENDDEDDDGEKSEREGEGTEGKRKKSKTKNPKKQANKKRKLAPSEKKKKGKKGAGSLGMSGFATGSGGRFAKKKLEQVLYFEGVEDRPQHVTTLQGDTVFVPSYYNNAARPSFKPRRYFCSICGYLAPYTCVRCGQRYCSLFCSEQHKETKCMKFRAL